MEIKFVSYDGDYPCLCGGTLILNIDGEDYYALSMDDLNSFKENKIKSLEQSIEARECEIKHYRDMIANLRSEN